MKNNRCKNGFTLIELLVVVLIIGILAAIALPQYKKAVQRSKNAQLKAVIGTIEQAQKLYFMNNGKYAVNFDELSVDLPLSKPQISGTSATHYVNTTCGPAVQGSDAIRRGKDFEVILNTTTNGATMGVMALWTTGKYVCTGFTKQLNETKLVCTERYDDGNAIPHGANIQNKGHFCVKLEKGFNNTSTQWNDQYWDLP